MARAVPGNQPSSTTPALRLTASTLLDVRSPSSRYTERSTLTGPAFVSYGASYRPTRVYGFPWMMTWGASTSSA